MPTNKEIIQNNTIANLEITPEEIEKRPFLEDIKDDIENLHIKTGPADVTAFHDYNKLDLAFENIWTEIFDNTVKGHSRELWEEIVDNLDLPDDFLTSSKYDQISSLKELNLFLEESLKVSQLTRWQQQFFEVVIIAGFSLNHYSLLQLISIPYDIVDLVIFKARDEFLRGEITKNQLKDIVEDVLKSSGRYTRLEKFLRDIDQRQKEPYRFKVFAPGAINYGVVLQYRQTWVPKDYQVGELIHTLPLAPKETRKYSKKTITQKKRTKKELENALRILKTTSKENSKTTAQISDKVNKSLKFGQQAEGGAQFEVWNIQGKTNINADASEESAKMKTNIREATKEASEEYRNERKIEISTEDDWKFEETSSAEISNPNDEIPVTYLFYQLQRQYEISEKLHRITPVILVADEIPAPHDIDEDWLLSHDWILKRVLLDDSFIPALNYLSEGFAADEFIVREYRNNMAQIRKVVEDIRAEITTKEDLIKDEIAELEKARESHERSVQSEESEGLIVDLYETLYRDIGPNVEVAELKIENVQKGLDRLQKVADELKSRLRQEVIALNEATRNYSEKMQEMFRKRVQIDRLRIHVKNNILYYMQEIWRHEIPDQRYFRLADKKVLTTEIPPTISFSEFNTLVENPDVPLTSIFGNINKNKGYITPDGHIDLSSALPPSPPPPPPPPPPSSSSPPPPPPRSSVIDTTAALPSDPLGAFLSDPLGDPLGIKWRKKLIFKKLSEVADITKLIGFFGNYMIFPLREDNFITLLLMADYITDTSEGLTDPDWLSTTTIEEIIETVNAVDLSIFSGSEEKVMAIKKFLQDCIRKKLISPYTEKETIIVPTESLYIEALTGKQPLLEDFKLLHRAIDVKKAKAEYREQELEVIRKSARIILDEKYDDEVEKKIVLKSNATNSGLNINTE